MGEGVTSNAKTQASGGLSVNRLLSLPFERRKFGYLVVGHGRQFLQHVLEVRVGIDAVHPAVLDEREHCRIARPGFFGPEEQPVFLSHAGGPDRVLYAEMPIMPSIHNGIALARAPGNGSSA